MASVDYFLKIDGVPGESQDAKHRDEIEVLAFSWKQQHPVDTATGQSSGKTQMLPFEFTMHISKATPKLYLSCAQGAIFPTVVFTARKAGAGQQDYLKISFQNAILQEFTLLSNGGANTVPLSSLQLSFQDMEISYLPQQGDGKMGGAIKGRYNIREMQAK
jgi:type VI secretion system secreted protein Hcp